MGDFLPPSPGDLKLVLFSLGVSVCTKFFSKASGDSEPLCVQGVRQKSREKWDCVLIAIHATSGVWWLGFLCVHFSPSAEACSAALPGCEVHWHCVVPLPAAAVASPDNL